MCSCNLLATDGKISVKCTFQMSECENKYDVLSVFLNIFNSVLQCYIYEIYGAIIIYIL